jgi:hypothetical protein
MNLPLKIWHVLMLTLLAKYLFPVHSFLDMEIVEFIQYLKVIAHEV